MNDVIKGVPVPPRVTKKRKYFFERMTEVDDFDFFSDVKIGTINSTLAGHKSRGLIPKEWRFTVRKYNHEGKDGVGVWRVE